MQKRWLSVFFVLLLCLTAGAAIVLAESGQVFARTRIALSSNQGAAGVYTLNHASSTKVISADGFRRPFTAQPMQGGTYTVQTAVAGAGSPHFPQAEEEVTAVVTHTHSVNPGAFLYDQDSPDITMSIYYGLRWQANSSERAGFYMSRPADWDGQSPVKVRITFALGSSEAGAVNWRMRLNRYTPNSGEWLTNPASRDADQILVFASGPSSLRIYEQTFTLQPQDFNDEPYWAMFFVRGDGTNGETFTDPLYVMGVDVLYQATR